LRKAHQQNDRAVMQAYGFSVKGMTESTCVAELMRLYQKSSSQYLSSNLKKRCEMGTIFVAGVYGVGKSTLCKLLGKALNVPFFSAGDLISQVNGEKYGINKTVKNMVYNQNILATEVEKRLKQSPVILLAGHFCIFDKYNKVESLPCNVFDKLYLEQILLLEADVIRLIKNLKLRDNMYYEYNQILRLQNEERTVAKQIAKHIGCPFNIHHMSFDDTDFVSCLTIVKESKLL